MVISTKRFQIRKFLPVLIISLIPVLILFWLLAAGSAANIYAAGPPVLPVEDADHNDQINHTANNNDNHDRPALYQQTNVPVYGPAVILMEDIGGSIIEMLPAYAGTSNILDIRFFSFDILKEGDTYYLWLNSWVRAGAITDVFSKEQRFESQDGLVWSNRTDTNLSHQSTYYEYVHGLREIIKTGNSYEGWEQYYYEWTSGWGESVRYVTSNDGINWTVVNQPALIGARYQSVIKDGNTYKMWVRPDGDFQYTGTTSLRYRTSTNGGAGWGHWQTGGALVTVDGNKEVSSQNRVRQLSDNTYQLFYREHPYIHMATSTDGIAFTTQITELLNLDDVLVSALGDGYIIDFNVVDIEGEDWFYFTYCMNPLPTGYCQDSRIAVSRPIKPSDLTITKAVTPTTVEPGDLITYTLTFSNAGSTATSTNVIITDIMPINFTPSSVSNSGAIITDTGTSPSFVWDVQDLAPGQGGVITIVGQVDPELNDDAVFTNTASIAGTGFDPDADNNTDSAAVSVDVPPIPADLLIAKSVSPATVTPGNLLTYTLTFNNDSVATTATGVIITDILPFNFTPLSVNSGGAVITDTGASPAFVWDVQDLAPGQGGVITIVGQVDPNLSESTVFTNTALITGADFDADTGNNTASAAVSVEAPPQQLSATTYLPVLLKNNILAPDLIVSNLIATSNGITITIRNIGNAPATDSFWVDVYIDPDPAPSEVNQHWWELAAQGLVWGVTSPIGINDTLTLTIDDAYYSASYSGFSGTLPVETQVYAQVDSVNLNTNYGGVLELDEILTNRPYNNITGTLSIPNLTNPTIIGAGSTQSPNLNKSLPPR